MSQTTRLTCQETATYLIKSEGGGERPACGIHLKDLLGKHEDEIVEGLAVTTALCVYVKEIETCTLMGILTSTLRERVSQHVANLEGWSEGEFCSLCRGTGRLSVTGTLKGESKDAEDYLDRLSDRPLCPLCNGHMIKPGTQGYLCQTEPDPEERRRIREGLRAAIHEIQYLAKVLMVDLGGKDQ